jgi:hypothetical protein
MVPLTRSSCLRWPLNICHSYQDATDKAVMILYFVAPFMYLVKRKSDWFGSGERGGQRSVLRADPYIHKMVLQAITHSAWEVQKFVVEQKTLPHEKKMVRIVKYKVERSFKKIGTLNSRENLLSRIVQFGSRRRFWSKWKRCIFVDTKSTQQHVNSFCDYWRRRWRMFTALLMMLPSQSAVNSIKKSVSVCVEAIDITREDDC